jgi:hypothetical protein
MDKRSSLLRKFVNYGEKSFIELSPDRRADCGHPSHSSGISENKIIKNFWFQLGNGK